MAENSNPKVKISNKSFTNYAAPDKSSLFGTRSDGNIIEKKEFGFKQKLINKVKTWSHKDKISTNQSTSFCKNSAPYMNFPSCAVENINLCDQNSEYIIYQTEILDEPHLNPIRLTKMDSKTVVLDPKSTIGDSASKILTWDPWNKLARKNKNEKKRKEKQSHSSKLRCTSSFLKNHPSGDELHTNSIEAQVVIPKSQEIYEYQPYKTAKKSVDFVNEVSVMHFAGDVIIDQTMEPLKKELDQQIRNKEMRRGHIPCTLLNKKVVSEDYMSGWFKK